ncbi:MAG: hypothetical protein GKR89_24815 [Candidatus Latescibacteria bacterium]|nr:hypothetical protein [Candidatus Latescibacterota bacterium]
MTAADKDQWRLQAGDEWIARDPFGAIKTADSSTQADSLENAGGMMLRTARNAYSSFRLWVQGSGPYRLHIELDDLEVDLFRAWYHRMKGGEGDPAYCVDALIPLQPGTPQHLPDPDNQIATQTQQEFWVDIFAPAAAAVGRRTGRIELGTETERVELAFSIEVLDAVVPDQETVICDHNSYGSDPFRQLYPRALSACGDETERTQKTIEIIHHYYRICREHRGLFSNLGAGHNGSCGPIYGPPISGEGRAKNLGDWRLFDQHYGPLLDGSAFATASPGMPRPRRPVQPLWGVYTPITPDWPANYLWWGQPGYQVEFNRCLQQFDQHLRDRGWVHTRPYFFFNHKKRYRWYEWDGDEGKYGKDDQYLLEMSRLFNDAVGDSPVPWTFRLDSSWRMQDHFKRFAGLIDLWICGGFASWYPDQVHQAIDRGEMVWTYSGTPEIDQTSSALLEHVLRMWARGIGGHVEWLTTAPGPNPWFDCDGAATGMIYPGDRFGLDGPLPSIRLKLQRNAVQDIDLIDVRARAAGRLDQVRTELAACTGITLWEEPPEVVHQLPPEQWDSRNLSGSQDDEMSAHAALDPRWWSLVRRSAQEGEKDNER